MEVIIKGTKEEIKELLAEIRRKDKEYITVPSPITINPCEPIWKHQIYTPTWATSTGSTMGDGYAKGGNE